MTYGQVAERAARPGAARAVGRAMATNPFAILVPCHRVVAKGGLGGYLWGTEMKEKLLRLERVSSTEKS
jgi:methylated-DNA-[protein]-cysteine S-methyltransferase